MFASARYSSIFILWLSTCCGLCRFQVTSYQMSTFLYRRAPAKFLQTLVYQKYKLVRTFYKQPFCRSISSYICTFKNNLNPTSFVAQHSRFLSSQATCENSELGERHIITTPLVASVSIDPEIISCMNMKSNHRKTRILFSPKSTLTMPLLRRAIENKFFALTGKEYKLRYRMSRYAENDLKQMKGDVDLMEALRGCAELRSSMQLFVEVNPGVFPAADPVADVSKTMTGAVQGEGSCGAVSKQLHPSVLAMRAARLDPADSDSYVMVSFYGFRTIEDPREFSHELERLWRPFQALGRVYVAKEGVNAQMAVPSNVLRYFEEATRSMPVFANMRLNTDDWVSREQYEQRKPFRALHVRPRKQILADGFDSEPLSSTAPALSSTEHAADLDWTKAGQEMHPLEWHRRLSRSSVAPAGAEDSAESAPAAPERAPLVLDCRNSYESDVGLFDGAVPLNTTFFRESWPVLEELLKDTPRDAPVLTYCTGGIRCVKVNAYLQQKMGFTNTHRLAGGIIAYNRELEALRKRQEESQATDIMPLESTYKGVNYVFDERIGARVTEDVLTACEQCAGSCDTFTNCLSYPCNVRFIQCSKCRISYSGCCSKACQTLYSRSMGAEKGESVPTAQSMKGLLSRKAQRSSHSVKVEPTSQRPANIHSQAAAPAVQVTPKFEHAYNSAAVVAGAGDSGGVDMMEALAMYCERHSSAEPALLQQLRTETLAHYAHSPGAARMLCDPLQGRLLSMLVSLSRAEHVLELGAFTGYSAICLALGLDGDKDNVVVSQSRRVISCEPDPVARGIAQKHVHLGGLQDRVDIRDTKAADLLKSLQADSDGALFDLVFLDADKKQYIQYLHSLMGDYRLENGQPGRAMLRDGALLVVDNTLWKGLVLGAEREVTMQPQTPPPGDSRTAGSDGSAQAAEGVSPRMRVLAQSMHAFNAHVAAEPRLKPVMLPIRDGLTVIQYRAL